MTIEYGKDVAQTLSHLDMSFFQEVVENALRETNVKVERVHFAIGSSIGDNYLSQIYRTKVQYKIDESAHSEELSVIIKSMPQTEVNQFLDDLQVFLKEKIIYLELLPRMEMFLPSDQRFGARLYHSIKQPINTFVFEDLNVKHFEMASRETGLDEAHARLVMQRLAKFHATSMVLGKKDPVLMKKCFSWGMLAKGALQRDNSLLLNFFGGSVMALLNLISKWQGYEAITKKVRNYTSDLPESLSRSQEPLPGELKVLNHGDLWVNNMLFKYDQQRNVQDLIFVDFQMSVWGSPGIDLNYFFYTSLQLELLKQKREQLIREYHNVLCDTLQSLSYTPVPSYQQIQQEVKNRESFGFFANIGAFPTLTLDKEQSSDNSLDNLADEDFARKKLQMTFATKRVEDTFKYTLKQFDELNIWD